MVGVPPQNSQANIPIPVISNIASSMLAPPLLPLFHPATVATHNLIPAHMQASALAQALSLNGTPGYQPAFIHPTPVFDGQPILTVQDRPMIPPVYNGVHPQYPGLQMLHANPPVFCVENFLTPYECDFLINAASDCFTPAPVVGKGAGEVSSSRTSSTCYLAREDLPDYLRKVSLLTGKPVEHCELPQVGRYLPTQQYLQHFDAFDLSNEDGRRFAANGGQRTVTVLVYLNDVSEGGQTAFPALNLEIKPKRGMAVVFFPATVDGLLDKMALHAALPAAEGHVKYVSQVWIRQGEYKGQPSKRLSQTLGVPFHQPTPMMGISYQQN
jgi:prolyl 4-hydroxylase